MRGGSPRAPLTAALGAAFIGAGVGFGMTVALVCGVGLLLLAGGAVAWVELATARGRLEREPGPTRIDERSPYPLRLRLRGTLLPPPGGELRDPLLERPVAVGPRWRGLSRDVSLEGPGRRKLGTAQLIVEDPLGLWRRERHSATGDDLIVLPRVEPVHWDEGGGAVRGRTDGSGGGSDAPSGRGGPAQFEVDGLRPYRNGSPASRIHWPAVARTGQMFERQLVADGDPRPLVVFDPREDSTNGDREDHRTDRGRAMRAAASLCVALAKAGGCDLLVPGTRRALTIDPALRGWPEAHTSIAVADPRKGIAAPAHLRGGLVVWVTAGGGIPGSLRGLDPRSVVVTPRHSRRSAVFRVAGCFAYPVVSSGRRAAPRRAAA